MIHIINFGYFQSWTTESVMLCLITSQKEYIPVPKGGFYVKEKKENIKYIKRKRKI